MQTLRATYVSHEMLKSLWRNVFKEVLPILKDSYKIIPTIILPKYWDIRRTLEQLQ